MSDEIRPESTVNFTVKELLDEQTTLLREIDRKVDQKADRADVVALTSELRATDARVTQLESANVRRTAVSDHTRQLWGVILSIATLVVMLTAGFIYNLTTTVHHP